MWGGLFNKKTNKTCPRCGDQFICASGDKCWCDDEMHLCRETLKKIRLQYIDCLCKDCLKYYVELDKHSESKN